MAIVPGEGGQERADKHKAEHGIGPVRRGDHGGAHAHGVAHEVRRSAEAVDECEGVGGQRVVVVRGEGGVGVAVAAKVEGRDPEAGGDECGVRWRYVDRSSPMPGRQTTSGPSPVTS